MSDRNSSRLLFFLFGCVILLFGVTLNQNAAREAAERSIQRRLDTHAHMLVRIKGDLEALKGLIPEDDGDD